MPWQLSGNGRSGWSTKLIRGLKAEAAAGFQSRRGRCREPTPVTPQYAAFPTYKRREFIDSRPCLGRIMLTPLRRQHFLPPCRCSGPKFCDGFCTVSSLFVAASIELPDDCLGGRSAIDIAVDDLLDVVLRPRQNFADHPLG